jgi:hypothetical protein
MFRRLGLATVGQLIGLTQHPVEARFRGDVEATVGQRRHDLTRRHMGKFLAVGNGQHALAFVLREFIVVTRKSGSAKIGVRTQILLKY